MSQYRVAVGAFEHHFSQLLALVRGRLEVEWQFHKRADLKQMEPDLLELVREFGALLRVVYRYDLRDALKREAAWYALTLATRGPGADAFALLLDSWVIAIQVLIKPPECNILAAPLQNLRENSKDIFAALETRRGISNDPGVSALAEQLVVGDYGSARDLLRSGISSGMEPHEIIVRMLLPAMSEIGRRWELNELAIFQEHLATETTQKLIYELSSWASPAMPITHTALLTCVPNDEHQVLPTALRAYLELRGWDARSLGRSLPSEQIVKATLSLKPDAVFASLSMLSRLIEAIALITHLRGEIPNCRVLVGGRGAEPVRELLEENGAIVVRDFDEAHRRGIEGGASSAF